MNKTILIGRLTKDPDVRYAQADELMVIARYTLAVDRRGKKDGEQTADFISCVAFGKQGEFAEKYLHKGMKIAATGRIQTGSYTDKETGKKVYTTDVVVEEHEFVESKSSSNSDNSPAPTQNSNNFMDLSDGFEDELPFQ